MCHPHVFVFTVQTLPSKPPPRPGLLFGEFCLIVCLYVLCMFTCVQVHVLVLVEVRGDVRCFVLSSPSYYFETDSLPEPGAELAATKP